MRHALADRRPNLAPGDWRLATGDWRLANQCPSNDGCPWVEAILAIADHGVVLIPAIVLITAALAFYSAGVWSERRVGRLRWRHAALFGAGLVLDASGTALMTLIAAESSRDRAGAAGILNGLMAWTGAAALALMAVHLAWAVVVLIRNRESERLAFHRFSLAVWALWLIPYLAGALGSAA